MNSPTRALCLAACSWLALACSSEEDISAVPRGPEDFAIGSVATVDTTVKASGGELEIDSNEPLLVSILPKLDDDGKLGSFLLAAPGSCNSVMDCGWIVLSAKSSACSKTVETASASSPIRVDLPVKCRSGEIVFRAELRDSDGEPVLTEADEVLSAEFTVDLSPASD